MSYAFIQDVPADEAIYAQIRAKLPTDPPAGMIAHVVIKRDGGGLRYVDVWEREADWVQFRDEHVEPAVTEVLAGYGIPHDHELVHTDEIDVIDVWLGTTLAQLRP
ncbi:MAG: hypothetical protein QOE63_1754 [Acidimicrobiaceae bacterium]|jgi:hypothetical protein